MQSRLLHCCCGQKGAELLLDACSPGIYSELMPRPCLALVLHAAARDFVRQCCVLLGQAQDSPLLVTVAAGAAALPTLLKLATVIGDQVGQDAGWG